MYYLKKRFEVSASHSLKTDYDSKCKNAHGHNWIITVHCMRKEVDANGMIIDFSRIKKLVNDEIDHKNLNEVLDFNPTAENIARWVHEHIPYCYKVEVQESEGNTAIYENENI